MSWDRNNLAPHALPSFLCDSLSSSSAGLNLGRHLGQAGMFPMVAGNGPNTSLNYDPLKLCFSICANHLKVSLFSSFILRI